MSFCCCSLAGTAACQHCRNNPLATNVWSNAVVDNIVLEQKSQTNADRIRSMTDEELAELLGKSDAYCPPIKCPIPNEMCNPRVCWLVWLEEEAKE